MKLSTGWGYFIWETACVGRRVIQRPVAGPYAYRRTAYKAAERMTQKGLAQGRGRDTFHFAAELDPRYMSQALLDDYKKATRST